MINTRSSTTYKLLISLTILIAFTGMAAAAQDTVTLHDSAQGTDITGTSALDGETVFVKVTDGTTTTGGTNTVSVSSPNGGSISVTVYDDGTSPDNTGSDGAYWGSFSVTSGTTDDASDTLSVDDANDATVNGDLDGQADGGSATITADYTAPTVSGTPEVTSTNQVTVTFSEGVYSASAGTGDLTASQFTYTDTSSDGASSISSVSHTAGSSTATLTLNTDVKNSDLNSDTIDIATDAIYDQAGNGIASTSETYADASGDDVNPTITSAISATESGSDVSITFSADEQLSSIDVGIDGSTLTTTEFSESGNGPYTYTATYTPGSDGTYTATLNSVSDGTNTISPGTTSSATVDTTGPTFGTVTSPADPTNQNQPTVSIDSVTDSLNNVDETSIQVDLIDSGSNTDVTYTGTGTTGLSYSSNVVSLDLSTTVDTLTDDTYDVFISASDDDETANSNSNTYAGAFTVDTQIDTAIINSPTGSSPAVKKSGEIVTVDYNAQDSNFETATVKINNGPDNEIASSTVSSGDSTVDLTIPSGTTDGSYDVVLTVDDTAGNSNTVTETGAVTVDDTAPTNSNNAPTTPQNNNQVPMTVDLSDATSGIDANTISVTVNDGTNTHLSSAGTGDNHVSWSGTTLTIDPTAGTSFTLADGTTTVTVNADDNAGNSMTQLQWSFTVDTTPPTVENLQISDGDGDGHVDAGDSVTIQADVSETNTVSSVTTDASAFDAGTVTLTDGNGDDTWDATFTAGTTPTEGDQSLTVNADDEAGNTGSGTSGTLTVDTTDPVIDSIDTTTPIYTQSGQDNDIQFSYTESNPVEATITVGSNSQTYSSVASSPDTKTFLSSNLPGEGTYDLTVQLKDEVDRTGSTTASPGVVVDDTAPTTEDDAPTGWQNSDVSVTLDPSDTGSGVSTTYYCVDQSDSCDPSQGSTGTSVTVSTEGTNYVRYYSVDNAGNQEATQSATVELDKTNPSVSAVSVTDNTDSNGVVNDGDEVLVTADVTDTESGVDSVTIDGSNFGAGGSVTLVDDGTGSDTANDGTYTGTFTVTGSSATEGSQSATVTATDNAGNTNTGSDTLEVDTTSPSDLSIDSPSSTVYKKNSGSLDVTYSYNDENPSTGTEITLTDGTNSFTYTFDDSTYSSGTQKTVNLDLSSNSFVDGNQYDIQLSATDAAGNTGAITPTNSLLEVDDSAPTGTIASITPSPITDSETGDTNEATVTVTFDEDMQKTAGDVTVTPDVNGELSTTPTVENKQWTGAQTFTVDLQFADDNEEVTGVDLEVAGAKDLAGNVMSTSSTTYDVDTVAPTRDRLRYVDADNDAQVDEVHAVYSETLDSSNLEAADFTLGGTGSVDTASISDDTIVLTVTGTPPDNTNPALDLSYTADSSGTADPVQDTAGNGISDFSGVTISDAADPVIDFSDGMNMVSFPSKVGVYDLGTLLDDSANVNSGNVDAVWSYRNGEWKSYDPDRSDSNNEFTNVEGGHGYILEASGSGKIVADVDQGDKDEKGASGVELISSQPWHLIGTYQESPTSTLADAGNDLSTSDVDQVLERDGSGSFASVNSLNPGDGYWISVNSDRSYNPVFN